MKKRNHTIRIGRTAFGAGRPLALIAGPCVIESRDHCLRLARRLDTWTRRAGIPFVFKASFDKANRTGIDSFRGPGMDAGLAVLAAVKQRIGCSVLTDVHDPDQLERVAGVVDAIQIPAFLCRQTDLVVAAARTGLPVNVKKGQFMAPEDMQHVIAKIEQAGNHQILLTERGSCFGYHNLVVDMRGLETMRAMGYPVVFDATHSVQRPAAGAGRSGGDAQCIPALARAAAGAGCDAMFMEVAFDPEKALCDGANSIAMRRLPALWRQLTAIDRVARDGVAAAAAGGAIP